MSRPALLALADGRTFSGRSFGAEGEAEGEIVFNTSMSGYQEVITDPSYCGQMVVMTYPLIGNYGVNQEDFESARPYLKGFIIKELSGIASNWRSQGTLDDFLRQHGVIGLQGLDTRALTRHIRDKGAQQAVISTRTLDPAVLVEKARKLPGLTGRDLVREVTCAAPYDWDEGEWELLPGQTLPRPPSGQNCRVVAYDFGIKQNILRKLVQAGCQVRVVPASTTAAEILEDRPDGVFLSNGPGDPAAVSYAIENVRNLIGRVPIFGICLGHQILSLALGAGSYKLRFGHHGGNQPVMDLATRKVEITAQNHGFAIDQGALQEGVEVTSINLNDETVEGLRHRELPLFSVQYHPEASPGPHDSDHLFQKFVAMMEAHR